MDRQTWTTKNFERAIDPDASNYRKIYLVIENYGAIDIEKYVGIDLATDKCTLTFGRPIRRNPAEGTIQISSLENGLIKSLCKNFIKYDFKPDLILCTSDECTKN